MSEDTPTRTVKLKPMKDWGTFDVSTWELNTEPKLLKVMQEAVNEALEIALQNELYAAFQGDSITGEPIDDPLTIVVSFPFGAFDDGGPWFSFSFRDLVAETIRDFPPKELSTIRDALADIVRIMDICIAREERRDELYPSPWDET